jgi:hypothetical protein
MIHQFRTLYPQGSLISKLIKIDCGKYLVKASVQVDGVTLTTGLAAADTIELAEDRARQRALEAIALDVIVVQQTKSSSSSTEEINTNISSPEIAITQPKQEGSEAIEETSVIPVAKKTRKEKKKNIESLEVTEQELTSLNNESNGISESVDLEINEVEQGNRDREQLVNNSGLAETEEIEEEISDLFDRPYTESYETKLEETTSEKQGSLFDEPISSNFSQTASVSKSVAVKENNENQASKQSSAAASTSPKFNVSDLMTKTNVEIKRLGWTNEQGKDFLIATYGKRSRTILSDEELNDFLEYLQNQPTP